MTPSRIIGIVLTVAGIVLLVFGINETQSLTGEVREGLTGRYSGETMWLIIGGIVLIVGGGLLAAFGGGRHA